MASTGTDVKAVKIQVAAKPTVGSTTESTAEYVTAKAPQTAADDKKRLGEIRPNPSALRLPMVPSSIKEIADQPGAREALKKFANQTLVEENVNFIFEFIDIENELDAAVSNFHGTPEEIEKEKERVAQNKAFQEKFQNIYARFILERASQCISISSELRHTLNAQNNGHCVGVPIPTTAFKLATFKEIYNEINKDLYAPLLKFQAQIEARRKSHNAVPHVEAGFKRRHSFSRNRSTLQPTATATATESVSRVLARHPITVHVMPASAALTTRNPAARLSAPPSLIPPSILTNMAAIGSGNAGTTGITGNGSTHAPSLHYLYSNHLPTAFTPNPRADSVSIDPHLVTYVGGNPALALETQPGTGTSTRPSPTTTAAAAPAITDITMLASSAAAAGSARTAAGLSISSNLNPNPLVYKNAVISLSKQLKEYLETIKSYQDDEACCTCFCFKSCKKNKPAIYINIKNLADTLNLSLQCWTDEKIMSVKSEILNAQQRHQNLVGNEEQQIIAPLKTAHTTLEQYKLSGQSAASRPF